MYILLMAVYKFNTIDSTNNYIKNHLNELDDWDVVVANTQTEGRGRFKRKWCSPAGGLWFSTIFSPVFAPEDYGLIPIITGISTVKSLIKSGVNAGVKWPNDIILNKKKVGGILSEFVRNRVIIGIGINLNFHKELLDKELQKTATTILSETQKKIPIDELIEDIVKEVQENILLIPQDKKYILKLWRQFDILNGESIKFSSGGNIYYGKELGIDTQGKLLLKIDDKMLKFISGEIIFT